VTGFFKIDVKGLHEIKLLVKNISCDLVPQTIVDRIGHYLSLAIKSRTARGVDPSGDRFAPYAPGTVESRTRRQRPTKHVDLNDTGRMLAAVTFDATPRRVRVFFADATQAEKGFYLDSGTKRMPERPFFRLGLDDVNEIMSMLDDRLTEVLSAK